jgi:hypothetical protein
MKADDVDLLSRMSEIHVTRIHHTDEVEFMDKMIGGISKIV